MWWSAATHQEYVCRRNGKLLTSTGLLRQRGHRHRPDHRSRFRGHRGVRQHGAVINDLNTTVPAGYAILTKDAAIDSAVVLRESRRHAEEPGGRLDHRRHQACAAVQHLHADPRRNRRGRDGRRDGRCLSLADRRADIAFINPGGVRADLIYKNGGAVTYGDLLTVAPFGNTCPPSISPAPRSCACSNSSGKPPLLGQDRRQRLRPHASAEQQLLLQLGCSAGRRAVGTGNRVVAGSLKLNGVAMDMRARPIASPSTASWRLGRATTSH